MQEASTIVETIDLATARRLLAQARDTRPEGFHYRTLNGPVESCANVPLTEELLTTHGGCNAAQAARLPADDVRRTTGCLIGTMVKLHGVSDDALAAHPFANVHALHRAMPGLFDHEFTMNYLRMAQYAQDAGSTWHEAVAKAERYLASNDYGRDRYTAATGKPVTV